MPGQAIVAIRDKQWQVSLATTYAELVTGLSGVPSMPAGTGVLFDLGSDQADIAIDMSRVLFPLDIIFINSTQGVVGVLRNVNPGEEADFQAITAPGARYFLEVNAGEAEGIEVGDDVIIQGIVQPAFIELALPLLAATLVVGGVVATLGKGVLWGIKEGGSSSPSSEVRRLGKPRTEEERAGVHEKFYGTEELPPRGVGLIERGESTEGRRLGEPKDEEERRETHLAKYGTEELPERGKGLESRHSQKEEKTRFIGACEVVDGLCHTHGYSVSKAVRCPKSPLTDEEWVAAWELAELAYPEGMSNPWVNGWWPETMEEAEKAAREYEWKMRDAIRMFREKQRVAIENYERGADKAIYNYRRYVVREYEKGRELSVVASPSGHHSMWLTLEQRKDLEKKYGSVAVRWAEEATKPSDMKGVEAAAEYYYGKLKEVFGLGHLSPELTEKQIMKLREVLGLPKEVPPREKGYID